MMRIPSIIAICAILLVVFSLLFRNSSTTNDTRPSVRADHVFTNLTQSMLVQITGDQTYTVRAIQDFCVLAYVNGIRRSWDRLTVSPLGDGYYRIQFKPDFQKNYQQTVLVAHLAEGDYGSNPQGDELVCGRSNNVDAL